MGKLFRIVLVRLGLALDPGFAGRRNLGVVGLLFGFGGVGMVLALLRVLFHVSIVRHDGCHTEVLTAATGQETDWAVR